MLIVTGTVWALPVDRPAVAAANEQGLTVRISPDAYCALPAPKVRTQEPKPKAPIEVAPPDVNTKVRDVTEPFIKNVVVAVVLSADTAGSVNS